jgi:hypothetical protein
MIRSTPLSKKSLKRPSTSQRTTPYKNVIIAGCNLEEETSLHKQFIHKFDTDIELFKS